MPEFKVISSLDEQVDLRIQSLSGEQKPISDFCQVFGSFESKSQDKFAEALGQVRIESVYQKFQPKSSLSCLLESQPEFTSSNIRRSLR